MSNQLRKETYTRDYTSIADGTYPWGDR